MQLSLTHGTFLFLITIIISTNLSQNGEVHSGQTCRTNNKCSPEFDNPWNQDIALNAIESMSEYGKSKTYQNAFRWVYV